MMSHPLLSPGGAVRRQTAAQERYPLRRISISDLDPAVKDRTQRAPKGETLLGRERSQLVSPFTQGCVVSTEQKHPGAERQALSQRRRMSQPPSLSDCCVA